MKNRKKQPSFKHAMKTIEKFPLKRKAVIREVSSVTWWTKLNDTQRDSRENEAR